MGFTLSNVALLVYQTGFQRCKIQEASKQASALEENNTLEKQVKQGQCNVDTKKAYTNNMKTSD